MSRSSRCMGGSELRVSQPASRQAALRRYPRAPRWPPPSLRGSPAPCPLTSSMPTHGPVRLSSGKPLSKPSRAHYRSQCPFSSSEAICIAPPLRARGGATGDDVIVVSGGSAASARGSASNAPYLAVRSTLRRYRPLTWQCVSSIRREARPRPESPLQAAPAVGAPRAVRGTG